MKKLLITIFALSTCFFVNANAEVYLKDLFEVEYDESIQHEAFPIDQEIQDKYQAAAKQFSKKGFTQTYIVTYETLNNGVHVHVGWYADGNIATALDGMDAGKQVIFINGMVAGVSYDIYFYNGYFSHNYLRAVVNSYPTSQNMITF